MDDLILAWWIDLQLGAQAGDEAFVEKLASPLESLDSAGPVAAYRLTGGGVAMQELHSELARIEDSVRPSAPDALALIRGPSVTSLVGPEGVSSDLDAIAETQLSSYENYYALYVGFDERQGGEYLETDAFAEAIQLGTFNMATPNEEWTLSRWYNQIRMPSLDGMPGARRARRLVSVSGITKFGVLYEFTSLDARLKNFEERHERLALDRSHQTGRAVKHTVHAPWSPSVGRRVIPPV